jgi:DNA-binding PadR family transcriptional regulator
MKIACLSRKTLISIRMSAAVPEFSKRPSAPILSCFFPANGVNPPFSASSVRREERRRRKTKKAARKILREGSVWFAVVYRYIDHRAHMPKRRFDPLPSAAFQILLSLADEDLHGYGIMRQLAEQTGGLMRLGPGTLYGSIQSLLEEKLIEEADLREEARPGQERRRYYRLTRAGRKLARSEAERLADLLRVARMKKILRGDYV